jgi:hypothetical protein
MGEGKLNGIIAFSNINITSIEPLKKIRTQFFLAIAIFPEFRGISPPFLLET